MSNLRDHAERELKLAGVEQDIYGDYLSDAVLALIDLFSKQGHSGMSASYTLHLFDKVAHFKNITPLTDNPDEWINHGDYYQNIRNSSCFSEDGGQTYYDLDESREGNITRIIHRSDPYTEQDTEEVKEESPEKDTNWTAPTPVTESASTKVFPSDDVVAKAIEILVDLLGSDEPGARLSAAQTLVAYYATR